MVYIYKKKSKGKEYYYLRKSIKEEGKIIPKDLCYLGKDFSKINLNELEKKFPQEIKKSKNKLKKFIEFNYYLNKIMDKEIKENKFFNKKQLSEINYILIHYKKFNLKNKKIISKKFEIQFIIENNSIENSELTYFNIELEMKKISRFLEKKTPLRKKPLIQIYIIINTKKILDFLKKEKPTINLRLVSEIHDLLLKTMHKTKGFRFSEIKIIRNSFNPSSVKKIKPELKKLISWYKKNKTKIHPLALSILFHHKFEKIHPFLYGNGAVGRILLNYMLSQLDYPPVIIPSKKRKEYFSSMNKAYPCLKNDLLNTDMKYYKPLIDFMHKQFVKTYWDNFVV